MEISSINASYSTFLYYVEFFEGKRIIIISSQTSIVSFQTNRWITGLRFQRQLLFLSYIGLSRIIIIIIRQK